MTRDFLEALGRRYQSYVDTFRDAQGNLPHMLQLKWDHTLGVVKDARLIMSGERWPEEERALGEACALLHDAGRYSQLQEFGTFQDAKSIDHAARGVEVIVAQRLLEGLSDREAKQVLAAVAVHNKKDLPASLGEATARLAHLVRDADKLDIFRVMETAIGDGSLERNPEIAWELQIKGAPSPEVVGAVRVGHSVSYANVKTLSDFVLIQVGWLIGGFHFDEALRLAVARRALEYREAYLKTLSDDAGAALCCAAARAAIREKGLGLPAA